jgi:hypothetical protein
VLARLARAEVRLRDQRAPAAPGDRVGDLAGALGRRAVRQQDRRALRGERLGDGTADPAARSGYDRAQAFQPAWPRGFSRRV